MTINMAEMEPGKGGTSAKTSAGKIKSVHPFPNFFFALFCCFGEGGSAPQLMFSCGQLHSP